MYASRACDSCRRRKIKCDAGEPCAKCRGFKIPCEYNHKHQQRGPRVSKKTTGLEIVHSKEQSGRYLRSAASTRPHTANNVDVPLQERSEHISTPQISKYRGALASTSSTSIPVSQSLDLVTGPGRFTDSPTSLAASNLSLGYNSRTIHAQLIDDVTIVLASNVITAGVASPADVVNSCIDLFLQYMFPNTPIAHERTLRTGVALFLPDHYQTRSDTLSKQEESLDLSFEKTFTLITALCGFVSSVMPESLLANGKALATLFLQSSKAMLRCYEQSDLEEVDSTSITIRIWLSGALQNSTGKTGAAWHHHMEASLLALRLRLYDERSVQRDSAVESRLLRANFWLLYLADKSAACFENRASVLSEGLFESDLTLLEHCNTDETLLDVTKDTAHYSLESRILVGFHLKVQIWAAAADVITSIKAYKRTQKQRAKTTSAEESELARISELNIRFITLIFNLPPWLQHLDTIEAVDNAIGSYQKTCLWTLRSNIMTTYHCLKLIILQKCMENDLLGVLGLTGQSISATLRKLEIVQDFINELLAVPFTCYKVQGEAGVERIRRVGTIVLELVQNAENAIIRDRVRLQFTKLLDYLSRLDSKASDELGGLNCSE